MKLKNSEVDLCRYSKMHKLVDTFNLNLFLVLVYEPASFLAKLGKQKSLTKEHFSRMGLCEPSEWFGLGA